MARTTDDRSWPFADSAWNAHSTATAPRTRTPSRANAAAERDLIAQRFERLAAQLPDATRFERRRAYRQAKRGLDLLIAVPALVALLPLLLAIALLVRLDSPGPAIFRQSRVGYRGRPFRMLKFRTMRAGSTVRLDGPHKVSNDERVTRFGRLLRALSLDELPQLVNVVAGDMTLVGPRPELPEIVATYYQDWQFQRFLVPQGMTGWWQVTGRSGQLMHEHTDIDLHYLAHASIWFDLLILWRTIPAVLRQEGAF